jgi:hypothetical protein
MNSGKSRHKVYALLFFALLFGLNSNAQQAVTTASLGGTVEDQSGGRVVGAHVILTSTDQNQTWRTHTDDQGAFRIPYLPVGNYEIRVEQPRFNPFVQSLSLSVGQAAEMPIVLALASTSETVEVTEEVPLVESVRTQVAASIAPREVDVLPLNGRNYLDLALLSPNVSRTYSTNNDRFAETSAVPGTTLSVAGQRNLGNGFIVDGLSANDDAADLAGAFYSQEVIREFQVVTSGGIAEFGRAYSGTVNILTHSGTNDWKGRLYGFVRNQRFDAVNVFATVDPATGKRRKDPLTQAQYGATVGGPFLKDRVFFFSNFEQNRLNRAGFITITPSNAAIINARLAAIGFNSSNVTTGEYPTGDDRTSYFARGDFNISDRNRLTLRYSLYDIFSPNARNVGALNAVSRGTRVADRDNNIALNDLITLSPNTAAELRFQFTRSRLNAEGNDLIGPAVTITNVANFGASTSSPTERDTDLLELVGNVSHQKGQHFLKAGANLLYNRVNIVFPASLFGSYTFTSLPNFLSGTYNTNNGFTQSFGKIDWFQSNPNFGWFVQDEWRPRHDLTINVGLRHDVQWIIDPVETQAFNFSPRLGIAFAPSDHKTVFRAGVGLYYDRVPLRAVANALRGAGADYKTISIGFGQSGAPVFPNKLTAVPPGVLLALATIDPEIKRQHALQANLQVEREMLPRNSLSVGYQYLRGLNIIMQRNLNPSACTAAVDPRNLCRPNPDFANINQYSGQGDSYYHGLSVSVQNRSLRWSALRLSYTWSKAIDNTGNAFFSAPQDNFNIRDDRGLSDNDQRHRLTVSGQVQSPQTTSDSLAKRILANWSVSSIFTYSSAYPFNILVGGVNTVQGTAARPAGVGRNTGVGFDFATLDLRVSRTIALTERWRLEAMAEAFNALNRTNYLNPNVNFGPGAYPTAPLPSFGTPQGAFDPRQIQFGLRLNF